MVRVSAVNFQAKPFRHSIAARLQHSDTKTNQVNQDRPQDIHLKVHQSHEDAEAEGIVHAGSSLACYSYATHVFVGRLWKIMLHSATFLLVQKPPRECSRQWWSSLTSCVQRSCTCHLCISSGHPHIATTKSRRHIASFMLFYLNSALPPCATSLCLCRTHPWFHMFHRISYNMISSCFLLLRTLQRARMSWKPMAPRSGHRWSLTRKIKGGPFKGNRSLKSKQRRCRTMECRSDSSGFNGQDVYSNRFQDIWSAST